MDTDSGHQFYVLLITNLHKISLMFFLKFLHLLENSTNNETTSIYILLLLLLLL